MPQLDKLSFIPQLVWFFGLFFILYFLMAKYYLPAIGRTLKMRERLLTIKNENNNLKSTILDQLLTTAQRVIGALSIVITDLNNENQVKEHINIIVQRNAGFMKIKQIYVEEMKKLQIKTFFIK